MIKRLIAAFLIAALLFSAFSGASFAEGETTEYGEPQVTESPQTTEEPQPTDTPAPTETPVPTETPTPTDTPEPSKTPAPTDTPEPSKTPALTETPGTAIKDDALELSALKEHMSGTEQKLSTSILQLVNDSFLPEGATKEGLMAQMKEQGQIMEGPVTNSVQSVPAGTYLYVYIRMKQGSDFNVIKPYVAQIVNSDKDYALAAAYVALNNIEALAALDEVINITEVIAPVVNTGSVTSQGDSLLNADQMRAATGYSGAGVKVGIISDGVDHLANAVASGDLPSAVTVLSNSRGGDEGTAMLEIVHDLAPGVSLYFHDCGTNTMAFNEAITELADAGCSVICDDISWITQPFFQDGIVAEHVTNLITARDITYVSSAGNMATEHYQGMYHDDGGWHDFSGGTDPSATYLYARVSDGGEIRVILQWNDPMGGSANDYDMGIYDYDTADLISWSIDTQDGDDDPIEGIIYENTTGSTVEILIAVNKNPGAQDRILELYGYCDGSGTFMYSDNIVPEDSIFGHNAVPGVLCCGALNAASPAVIEDFSCRGPVTMLTETRQKPDICGIDGVYITGAGGFGSYDGSNYKFNGTSAAAPHIAAVAALLRSRFPLMPASQVRQTILNTTCDLGSGGYDYVYGYGRADATVGMWLKCVKFDSTGGTAVSPAYVQMGIPTSMPAAPTRTGYFCLGWYKEAACINQWNFADLITGDMTLYAKWTPVAYTITYNLQGGSAANPLSYTIESSSLMLNNPTRLGYNFAGWSGTDVIGTQMSVTIPAGSVGDRTYTANWAAQAQSNYLATAISSCGLWNRPFSPAVTKYKITIGENEGSFTLTPIKQYDGATMTINKRAVSSYTVSLANGKSAKISVKVTLGRKSKTYTFTVTRLKSSNNYLSSLSASAGTWSQAFDPNVLNYTLTLDENTKSTAIRVAAAAGKAARVSPASKKISLNNGQSKTLKITVKAQSGARRTYTINVVRAPSTNADLKTLRASGMSPGFSPGLMDYTITLPVNKSSVTISAKAVGYKATVYFDGAKRSSKKVILQAGQSTTVRVTVVAQSGASKTYTINIVRQISEDANLKSLKASGLTPGFSPGLTEYSVILPANKSSVSISAKAAGYEAAVYIDGAKKSSTKVVLANGQSAVVRVTVAAQAGNTKEYVITVIRQ